MTAELFFNMKSILSLLINKLNKINSLTMLTISIINRIIKRFDIILFRILNERSCYCIEILNFFLT